MRAGHIRRAVGAAAEGWPRRFATVLCGLLLVLSVGIVPEREQDLPPDQWPRGLYGERIREVRLSEGVRAVINLPSGWSASEPTEVVIYACPNGNSIEWTLGGTGGDDWHYEIQHVLAQVRRVREVKQEAGRQVVLVVIEAEGKSWPAWRGKRPDHGVIIRRLIAELLEQLPANQRRLTLMGHSGGGAFLLGYLNGGDSIGDEVDRIVFLDANYSFDRAAGHGEKLLRWLAGAKHRRLMVVAYDDQRIEIQGKPVLSRPDRGTWGATTRMTEAMRAVPSPAVAGLDTYLAADSQAVFYLHPNPDHRILHTRLVENNGVIHGLLWGTAWENAWGTWGPVPAEGDRTAYVRWITSAPGEGGRVGPRWASRKPDAPGGSEVLKAVEGLGIAEREERIMAELLAGNVPSFLRRFEVVTVRQGAVKGRDVWVSPDYLAVGSDTDWVRVPLTLASAQRVAKAWGCRLPTVEEVDAVWQSARERFEPIPLAPRGEESTLPDSQRVDARESVEALLTHHRLIEAQRKGTPGDLVAGVKKDLVETDRLKDRPGRVAIYGWHRTDGRPIQPLSTVHGAGYVDYSHGVRLVWDGK